MSSFYSTVLLHLNITLHRDFSGSPVTLCLSAQPDVVTGSKLFFSNNFKTTLNANEEDC